MTNFNERTNTLLYKNISLTLYCRKGDVCCVWEVSGDNDALLFWPRFFWPWQRFFLILVGVAQPWVAEGPKPSVCRWLSLRHLVPNWLEPASAVLPLYFRLFTQVHILIDGSVEGQYITLDVERTVGNLTEGSLNALPSLSLFTLMIICIFPAWAMGACGFWLSYSGFLEDMFFSLSLTIFGGRIGDLFMSYFLDEILRH